MKSKIALQYKLKLVFIEEAVWKHFISRQKSRKPSPLSQGRGAANPARIHRATRTKECEAFQEKDFQLCSTTHEHFQHKLQTGHSCPGMETTFWSERWRTDFKHVLWHQTKSLTPRKKQGNFRDQGVLLFWYYINMGWELLWCLKVWLGET